MNFEFKAQVAAPIDRVWDLMLNPKIMAGCMPGTESVEVISDVEYVAVLKVKISFIAARFTLRTVIVDKTPPTYLRFEGTGEDKSVASSLKQTTELFLTSEGSATDILLQTKAEVLGRLGSFGLSMMKTKADRLWEEFVENFRAIAEEGRQEDAARSPSQIGTSAAEPALEPAMQPVRGARAIDAKALSDGKQDRWWNRFRKRNIGDSLEGAPLGDQRRPGDIYIEVRRGDTIVRVLWPESRAGDAATWLKGIL